MASLTAAKKGKGVTSWDSGFYTVKLGVGVGLARAQYSLGFISVVAAFSVAFQLKGLAQDVLTGCVYSDVTSSQ